MIFIQAIAQLKALYKDDWELLMHVCDVCVYLGGNELSSIEYLANQLDKYTTQAHGAAAFKTGASTAANDAHTTSTLCIADEIQHMEKEDCIVMVKGENPFYDKKYKTVNHPNAKYLGDFKTGNRMYHMANS